MEILRQVKRAQASWSAMDCRTLTRAREIPIPGHQHAPAPLRTPEDLWGEEALASSSTTDKEKKLLSEHDALLAFQFEFMRKVHEMNEFEVKHLATFENPGNALLWHFQEFSNE